MFSGGCVRGMSCCRRISAISPILFVGIALAMWAPETIHAGDTEVAFDPSSSSVAVGVSIDVDVIVADVDDLGGYDVFIQFDPAIVQMTSWADSGFVTSGGNIVVCNTPSIDNVAGTATNSCATVTPFPPPGPGVSTVDPTPLINASFEAVGPGVSSLTLTDTVLQGPDGAPISSTLSSGSIGVSGTPGTVGGITELPGVAAEQISETSGASDEFPAGLVLLIVGTLAAVVLVGGLTLLLRRRSLQQ